MRSLSAYVAIIAICVLNLLLVGCDAVTNAKEDTSNLSAVLPKVKVATVSKRAISDIVEMTATVEPIKTLSIVPDTAGRVKKIYVEEGDNIKKGKLIATLDTKFASLQLDQAKVAVAMAETNLSTAEKTYTRMKQLYETKAISEGDYDQVTLAYEAAQKQVEQAKAAMALAEHQINISEIYAPFDGIVARKGVNEGDIINPGMSGMSLLAPCIITLVDISEVKLNGEIPERQVLKVKEGQNATSKLYSEAVQKFYYGKVTFVSPIADSLSHSFKVTVTVPNPDKSIKGGMFAAVQISTGTIEDGIVVPPLAILEEVGKTFLLVVKPDKSVEKREVEIGIKSLEFTQITSGVNAGDTVVVEGNLGLKTGMKVEITGTVQVGS